MCIYSVVNDIECIWRVVYAPKIVTHIHIVHPECRCTTRVS